MFVVTSNSPCFAALTRWFWGQLHKLSFQLLRGVYYILVLINMLNWILHWSSIFPKKIDHLYIRGYLHIIIWEKHFLYEFLVINVLSFYTSIIPGSGNSRYYGMRQWFDLGEGGFLSHWMKSVPTQSSEEFW